MFQEQQCPEPTDDRNASGASFRGKGQGTRATTVGPSSSAKIAKFYQSARRPLQLIPRPVPLRAARLGAAACLMLLDWPGFHDGGDISDPLEICAAFPFSAIRTFGRIE